MKRRIQLAGLTAVPLGAIALAVVALVLVMDLQQQLSDATARVDQLEAIGTRVDQLEVTAGRIPELEAAAAAAAALESRIRALEGAPASLDGVHPMLSAQGFRLVDDGGHERAVLQMEEDGPSLRFMPEAAPLPAAGLALGWNQNGPSLRIFDVSGKAQVFIGVTDGGPELTVNGPGLPASSARATLKLDSNGLPHFGMVDHEGRPRATLALSSVTGNGDGLLGFWDQDGDGRLLAGVIEDSPTVMLADDSDLPRLRLVAGPSGPNLRLNDAAGETRAELLLDADGTVGIGLSDDEELRAALSVSPSGSSLVFFGQQGDLRAGLDTNDDGAALYLYDGQGTIGVNLDVNNAGQGLSLADDEGNTRVTLAVTNDGPIIGFSDESGAIRAALGLIAEHGPMLEFADAQGTVRTHMSDTADGTRLLLQDEQGVPRAALGVSDAGGVVGLFDESGTLRTGLAHAPSGSGFGLYDAQGVLRANLGLTEGSPSLSLNDESQSPRVFAGFHPSTKEPFIATLDADLNLIWQSDEAPGSESGSETTAGGGG